MATLVKILTGLVSFSRSKTWLKRIILIGTFTIIGIAAMQKITYEPAFCGSCHEMKPQYVTWQASAHSKIACTSCHMEPEVSNLVQDKVLLLNWVYKHIKKSYFLPIELKKPMPNSVCESCHSDSRIITPSGDIKIPHDKHLAQGITCVTCHLGVAHGNIAQRQVTIDGNFDKWTSAVGLQNMVSTFRIVNMSQCTDCHKMNKAPLSCETCHKVIVTPPSHKTVSWVQEGQHGQEAYTDVQQCNKCHSNTLSDNLTHGSDVVASYVRSNTYCSDCHLKKPSSHKQDWSWQHGELSQKDKRSCMICHQQADKKQLAGKVVATTCNTCHGKPHSIPETGHPIPLPKGTRPGAQCYNCHSQQQCESCH